MLEKSPGIIKTDKLRAILLMEADFNFANRLYFGRKLCDVAEAAKILPPDQFGSRKEHSAKEVAICRALFLDIVRQKKWNAALGSYNAQNFYDRVAHSFSSLTTQAMGSDLNLIKQFL